VATTTTRLALRKPASGDTVNVSTDIGASMDTLDAAVGATNVTAATRPGSPFTGQFIVETDTNRTYVYDGGWLLVGSMVAIKTTDNTVNNTATLASDSQLTLPVEASTTYALEMYLDYSSATTPDAKVSLSVPASATWSVAPNGLLTSVAATSGSIETASVTTSGSITYGGNGAGTHVSANPVGWVKTAGTAGNVVVQWAQNTANASNTVLYTGSWIKLTRV
jgi:hypothetical protein